MSSTINSEGTPMDYSVQNDEETQPSPEGETQPAPEGETQPAPEGETQPAPEGETQPAPEGETQPVPEAQAVVENVEKILSLDDIINTRHTYLRIEEQIKGNLTSLDFELLKTNLYTWAAKGYQDSYAAYQLPVYPLPPDTSETATAIPCSDGMIRTIWDYIPFCLGTQIGELLESYQGKLHGISLTFSLQANPYILVIHVTKK